MIRPRTVSIAVLACGSGLAVANGCAFITCVEDDCASMAGGASPASSSGTGGSGSVATTTDATATSATSTGVGGGNPCTKHCVSGACEMEACQPTCSPLPGTGYAVTATASDVYAVTDEGAGMTTIQSVARADIGDPTTNAGNGTEFAATGHLATSDGSVFFGVESTLRHIDGTPCRPPPAGEVTAAAGGADRSFWLVGSTIESRKACAADPPLSLETPVALAAVEVVGGSLVGYSLKEGWVCSTPFSGGVYGTQTCFESTFPDPLSVAFTPEGKQLLFVQDGGVMSGDVGGTATKVLLPTGSGAVAVAATEQAYFVSRIAPQGEGTLLRCPWDGSADDCRSFGGAAINALHGAGDAVYFTMGESLCGWQ